MGPAAGRYNTAVQPLRGILAAAATAAALATTAPAAAAGCAIDTSAVSAFWDVAATLNDDHDPTLEQWRALLDNPGYDALFEREFERGFFKETFTISLKPSMRPELAKWLHVGQRRHFFAHCREVLKRRRAIDDAVARLATDEVAQRAVARAREFLPGDTDDACPSATIVVFDDGTRSYDTIVMDALVLADTDAEEFFAHEFHHWYRRHLLAVDFDALDPSDDMAVRALDVLQAEGVADFIDKELWVDDLDYAPESRREYAEQFVEAFRDGATAVADIDTLLSSFYYSHPEDRARYSTYLVGALPLGGQPTGFYMARLIDQQLGRDALIAHVGNPFAFIRDYNEAARRANDDHPVLGTGAMAAVSMLEERYVTRGD